MSTNKSVFSYLPLTDINSPQKLLAGLGKPTRRGIKKCVSCGIYNGTRSSICKNKGCRMVLKDSEERANLDLDAVKLLTGTSRQVYSVKVKDMGSDCRGFVQLPILQTHMKNESNILHEVALCFVESCQRSFDDSILKCHEETNAPNRFCIHINSAIKSQSTAIPINFRKDILQSLKLPEEFKEKLNDLVNEKDGPLVQRVSKCIMAVKCQVTPQQPLGYLHFTFIRERGKDVFEKYFCSCSDFLISGLKDPTDNVYYKCVHYYACIYALASDPKYSEEFTNFINLELSHNTTKKSLFLTKNMQIYSETTKSVTPTQKRKNIYQRPKVNVISNEVLVQRNSSTLSAKSSMCSLKLKRKQKSAIKRCKRIVPKIFPIQIKVLNETVKSADASENNMWDFLDWLTFVTESINKTMEIKNCGIINTQIFYIPKIFFECLTIRIPNADNYIVSQTELGVVYHIMNVLHLKEIFDTPKIKLRIAKKFIHVEHKGYIEFDESIEHQEHYKSCIFFLNVGESTVDESDDINNPFILEWYPNLFPLSEIGQLKLQYKYGKKNT